MKYNTENHKPMIIKLETKEKLDLIKKDLIIKSLNEKGTGRVSYSDVIEVLLNEFNKK